MAQAKPDVLVAGGGGFIGGHLVASLLSQGLCVRAADVKALAEWDQVHPDAENVIGDMSELAAAQQAVAGARQVYNLAADMGGIGFIENNRAACMLSVLTSTRVLLASREAEVERYFYSSSACVYATEKQSESAVRALAEADAYPAAPEDGYGWEKLFSERLCRHFAEDFGMRTRVARYHNIYGPHGTWDGGREKAPAAICRKVAAAAITGEDEIEIWGDGEQTRSFTYIDDCVYGTKLIMAGADSEPVNLGSSELVTINRLVDMIEEIAGVHLKRRYQPAAPQGVRGRNSDNTAILARYGWQPSMPLIDGLERTYRWVYDQVKSRIE